MRLLPAVAIAITLLTSLLPAQTVSGTLIGNVTDTSGAVIPNAHVVARNEQTQLLRETATNAEGFYTFSFMPIGTYELTVMVPGFAKVVKKGVGVDLNKNTVSDFTLKPSAVIETVEVSGELPIVETAQGDVKHGLTARQIDDTPLSGRNFMSLMEQVPGFQNAPWIGSSNNPVNSTGSYAVFNGTGSRASTFQIDGVNNDDSSENQNRQNVNVSAIREFQVLTNYPAEFGRAAGAVILVQTKSGTNQFHGDAYDYIQNDVFNANGFFNNQRVDLATGKLLAPKAKVRRQQYGWTLGGPIFKDRLFFFHSAERVRNVGSSSITRFTWLPSDSPRACGPGEVAKPGGPYCLDPATHPNMERDLAFMRDIMSLWKTPELEGRTPNDPVACADMVASGRQNRCVTVGGIITRYPDSDYSGKIDWNAPKATNIALRYQYSRQLREAGRIIFGDNYGVQNNRQYNIGVTATHVFTPTQTGEFRFGFGNRATLVDIADGNNIPVIRFSSTLSPSGTIIGSSNNLPINRRQHDTQFVYNHTWVRDRHTFKAGIDQRFLLLDDFSGDRARGYWIFGTLDPLAAIRAGTGFTGWENFLRGYVTGFQKGYGNAYAENRYNETNLYFQDDFRITRNLTLNLGTRWEGVGAPHEIKDRFSYGFDGDYNNLEPRFGFAWRPDFGSGWLKKLAGNQGDLVIRGGYGIAHGRMFQSVFSQSGLSIRTQPPNGYAAAFDGLCRSEISDPSCGFQFQPGTANRSSGTTNANGVQIKGGQLLASLLAPNPELHMPYTQQWNFAIARQLPANTAVEVTYTGNRTIGNIFYDGINDARFPITSPLASVDVGGGNFQPIVFDRVCSGFGDPICVVRNADGSINPNSSGSLRTFSAMNSTTATLEQKGIVIENGVPHGYISLSQPRSNERRPDPNYVRNVNLTNFGWGYYHGLITKFIKRTSRGLSLTASWTWSKAIDTGSEATSTGVDTNSPTGKGNAARSLRGLSSFDARHRVVISYGYELPWMRDQKGVLGRIAGGWYISGVTTFSSGNPYSVLLGYDANLDANGGDRPWIGDPNYLYTSVDNGRAQYPCPTAKLAPGTPCPDTISQSSLPGSVFIPGQAATLAGDQRILVPGSDGTGTIGRNTFFLHGMNNFDASMNKNFRITEGIKLNFRMEWYNLMNRVMFGVPAATVLSGTPMGRITQQRNPSNYINAARDNGSRMGQFALRLIF